MNPVPPKAVCGDYTTSGWEIFSQQAYVQMNQRKPPPFDNVKVRQAVYALNRKFIVDNIFFGLGRSPPARSRQHALHSADVPKYDYDLKKRARADQRNPASTCPRRRSRSWPIRTAPPGTRLGEYPSRPCNRSASTSRWTPPTPALGPNASPTPSSTLTFSFTSQYGDPALGVSACM